MTKKLLSFLKYCIFLGIGIGLFWLAIKDVPMSDLVEEFKKVHYGWIAITVIVMLLSHLVRAVRWNQLISTLPAKPKTHKTFYAVLVGYFANLAIPRMGEVTRCGLIARENKLPVNAVLGTVIAERAFDIICLLVIILITVLSQLSFLDKFLENLSNRISNNQNMLMYMIGGIALSVLLLIIFLRFFRKRLLQYKLYKMLDNLVVGFWNGVKTIRNVKNKKFFILNSVLLWGLYTLTIYLSFFAFEATRHLNFLDALTLMMMGSIGILAPVPGGIGTYQAVVKYTLIGLYLIPDVPATSFANIVYFTQWFMIIIFGSISWFLLILSSRKIKRNE